MGGNRRCGWGLPAIGANLAGYWKGFVGSDHNGTIRAALAIGGSVLLAATALAVALIVRGDVASRAMAHAARSRAEGEIIVAALTNYQFAQAPAAGSAPYLIQKVDGTFLTVSDINFADEKWFVSVGDAVVPNDQIEALISASKIKPAT